MYEYQYYVSVLARACTGIYNILFVVLVLPVPGSIVVHSPLHVPFMVSAMLVPYQYKIQLCYCSYQYDTIIAKSREHL
eukprot:COSAG02_NODE_31140_length_538_cov_1.824601_1_plen_77_part_01